MITVSHLCKQFVQPDGRSIAAIDDVSFHVERGEVVGIIGPSGAGKSVLLRTLNLLEPPTSGSITIDGEEILAKSYEHIRLHRRMGMVFQSLNLFGHLSVLDNVTLAPIKVLGMNREEAEQLGMEMLRKVAMAERADSMTQHLSGGQKQRVAIARCLAMKPEIVLLDEPTSSLDPTMVGEVQGVIRQLAQEKLTMVIVTHEMQFARDISSRVIFLADGKIVEQGTPDEIFNTPHNEATRAFVHRIRSLVFEIASRDFDFYDMTSQIKQFCIRHNLPEKMNPLTHVVEEMLLLVSHFNSPVRIEVNHSDLTQETNVSILHRGESQPPLDRPDTDELSAMIIRGMSKQITTEQTAEGVKTVLQM